MDVWYIFISFIRFYDKYQYLSWLSLYWRSYLSRHRSYCCPCPWMVREHWSLFFRCYNDYFISCWNVSKKNFFIFFYFFSYFFNFFSISFLFFFYFPSLIKRYLSIYKRRSKSVHDSVHNKSARRKLGILAFFSLLCFIGRSIVELLFYVKPSFGTIENLVFYTTVMDFVPLLVVQISYLLLTPKNHQIGLAPLLQNEAVINVT